MRIADYYSKKLSILIKEQNRINQEIDSITHSHIEEKKIIAQAFKINRSNMNKKIDDINIRLNNLEKKSISQNTSSNKKQTKRQKSMPQTTCNKQPKQRAQKKHVCSICNKILSRSDALKEHIRRIHTNKQMRTEKKYLSGNKFLCDICKEYYSRKDSLQRHMAKFHLPKDSSEKRRCLCGKSFNSTNSLRIHEENCIYHRQSTSKD